MPYLKIAWNFIKNLDIRYILIFLVASVSVFAYAQTKRAAKFKAEAHRHEANINALRDSTREYKTRNGELGKERQALQTTVEELKDLNSDLAEELEKERNNVKVITKYETVIKHDTVEVDSSSVTQVDSTSYEIDWSYRNSGDGWSRYISGSTNFVFDPVLGPIKISTYIENDQLKLSIVTGVREEDGKKTIFVRSNYDNIDFVEINGAVISEGELTGYNKRWYVGPALGYGYSPEIGFQPFIGVTVGYGFLRF